jgi:FtsZ-interacting cell division protein ZipA
MKVVIIILIILAVVLALALIWTAMKRKKDQAGRERASELRSEAAGTAAAKREQEARAREAEAEAERVRAQADKLEVRAEEERTSYDMTRAQQENAVREADRVDPDVDHRSSDYQPDLNGSPVQREGQHVDRQNGRTAGTWTQEQSTGGATPVPPGPETIVPEHEQDRRDQI